MKTKLFLGLMLFLGLSFRGSAQSTAEANGIAIQGIARDDNNTAMADEDIKLEFTIYFLDSSNNPANIYTENKTLHTDAFGVFSHVIQPGNVNYSKIANTEAYLKIEDADGVVFSDEKLKMVPYAVSAYNGVPTGAIMPFLGTTAPDGWMLCDGSAIPNTAAGTYLKALAAKDNNVPFYVALPSSTIDWETKDFKDIPIEERNSEELSHVEGLDENNNLKKILIYPKKSKAMNLAFDITPAKYITGLITERGVCEASKNGLRKLFK